MNGEELARELIGTLSIAPGIGSNMLLSAMLDRANVNAAAMGIASVASSRIEHWLHVPST